MVKQHLLASYLHVILYNIQTVRGKKHTCLECCFQYFLRTPNYERRDVRLPLLTARTILAISSQGYMIIHLFLSINFSLIIAKIRTILDLSVRLNALQPLMRGYVVIIKHSVYKIKIKFHLAKTALDIWKNISDG